eukprot:GFUD01033112.1.p1 GENE.GFUD01033112.1~~GFUD01033112.1.p1  ORF type:complete len:952 (+),score=280.10 GFUD01033112.1:70-2856(+)
MVKTRHGRKVRIPRHVLSKEVVDFNCQLCIHPSLSSYRDYVDHMIDRHLRVQLMRGLDMTKKQPTCPFPSCHGMTWPIVDNLLFHYASHHNVLEKVVMYESEMAAEDLRGSLREKEATIESLVKEIGELKESVGKGNINEDGEGRDDIIQGAKEMREIMGQMKQEIDELRLKVGSKNSMIKSLKDGLSEAKRSFKSCEKRYEDVVQYNLSIQTQLKNVTSDAKKRASEYEGMNEDESASTSTSQVSAEVSSLKAKIVELHTQLEGKDFGENNVSSSGETFTTTSRTKQDDPEHVATNNNVPEELEDLRGKVERLTDQNEAWQNQNDSLQLEIENMHMQNENLKNIIEIGKSTVETAKKISQDLAEENRQMKQREKQNSTDLQRFECDLKQLKSENQNLLKSYNELQEKLKAQTIDFSKLEENFNLKSAEVHHLYTELSSQVAAKESRKFYDENLKLGAELKLLTSLKEEIKTKLIKCRENLRDVEESKRSLEGDYKALILENRNAANEIKTLKNHLSSNRAIVVEKAVAKDEVNTLKTEIATKCIEVEKSLIKLKKLSTELNCVLGELKVAKDSKIVIESELKTLKEKMKKDVKQCEKSSKSNDSNEMKDIILKLKSSGEELSTMQTETRALKDAKKELQDRLEFYISQCTEFEKNDSQLQEEILLLQTSIKNSTLENSVVVEDLRGSIEELENSQVFYKDQEEVLMDENEKLKDEVARLKMHQERVPINEDLLTKYNLKSEMVEELLKKHEKIAAQLRRKDWEIDNYQKKLDSAFENGLLTLPYDNQPMDTETGDMVCPPADVEPRSPEYVALDLTTKEKDEREDADNNTVKAENEVLAGPSGIVGTSCKRKYSECSSASQTLNDSNPMSLHDNLDASFDSTSTCPSEAAKLSMNMLAGNACGGRRRSRSLGGPTPPKIPFVRLEDD